MSGFYSDRLPSVKTDSVKVLASDSEQEISRPEGCEIDPPELGDVRKFDLTVMTRCKLNPKQNFKTLNISKLFEDDVEMYEEEEEIEEQEDVTKLLLTQIARNQAQLIKFVWFVAIFLLFTIWL
ncbi:MAG: hypothetical protein O7D86_02355 [Proteobacteria bacterium]|nr:hypothetical protein [Pseudomonadota bacterium]